MTAFRRMSFDQSRRVAIVGSRHIHDYRVFCLHVRPLLRHDDILVSGGADGIDSLARRYARQNAHQFVEFPVDLKLVQKYENELGMDRRSAYGRAAGERNQQIVDYLVDPRDVMIAIRCPHSRGTPDSIARMCRRMRSMDLDPHSYSILRLYSYNWDCTEQSSKGGSNKCR